MFCVQSVCVTMPAGRLREEKKKAKNKAVGGNALILAMIIVTKYTKEGKVDLGEGQDRADSIRSLFQRCGPVFRSLHCI